MCEPVSAVFDVLNTFYCEAGVLRWERDSRRWRCIHTGTYIPSKYNVTSFTTRSLAGPPRDNISAAAVY